MAVRRNTYHGRVFAGNDRGFRGLDQGKANLYEGQTVRSCLNVNCEYNTLKARDGQTKQTESYVSSVLQGSATPKYRAIAEGTRFWVKRK